MSEIKNPLFGLKATGKIAKSIIFRRRKKKIFGVGFYFPGSRQKFISSEKQKETRLIYSEAVGVWRVLPESTKESYNLQAKGRALSGFNLFIKDYSMGIVKLTIEKLKIDGKVVDDYILYTVPTGFEFYPTATVTRSREVSGFIEAPDIEIYSQPVGNLLNGVPDFSLLDAPNKYLLEGTETIQKGISCISAGASIELRVISPANADIYLFDIYLIGFLRKI